MNEEHRGSDTSGQLGPKSKKPHSQFRQKSAKARPSERLQQESLPSVGKETVQKSRHLEKPAFRSEKTEAKLEKAVKKRNSKKPPKNPGPIKNVRQAAQYELYRYAHGKIHEIESENAGVEAAHRTEIAGERVVHRGSRFIKQRNHTRPARRVRKWEKRNIKAKVDLQLRKLENDHPEMKNNSISRFVQKQKLKRRYQRQARKSAKKSANAAKKTAAAIEKTVATVGHFVVSNPIIAIIAILLIVIVVMLHSCTAMMALLGSGLSGTVDGVADTAETVYTKFESDLQLEIGDMENTHPGYDEYKYDIGTIGHNSNELMGFLMAYDGFQNDDIESVLRSVFDDQYTLTLTETTEERETENEDGETVTEEISVLEIALTVRPFAEVISSLLTPEQLEQFNSYSYTQ